MPERTKHRGFRILVLPGLVIFAAFLVGLMRTAEIAHEDPIQLQIQHFIKEICLLLLTVAWIEGPRDLSGSRLSLLQGFAFMFAACGVGATIPPLPKSPWMVVASIVCTVVAFYMQIRALDEMSAE